MLRRVDLAGGMPVQIADPALAVRGGFWGSDGNILYSALTGVLRVPAFGGKVSLIAKPDTSRGEHNISGRRSFPEGASCGSFKAASRRSGASMLLRLPNLAIA